MVKKYKILFLLLLLTGIIYLAYTLFQTSGRSENIILFIIIYASAFILFIVALLLLHKNERYNEGRRITFLIIISGILFRLALIDSAPSTSDDFYRYLWEGRMILNFENPFEKAPDDPSLKYIHDGQLPAKVSFPHMTTIYPPIAQITFAAGSFISPGNSAGLKIIYLLFETMTLFILFRLLKETGNNEWKVVYYAWLPLPIMEYMVNAHIDAAGITFFLLFLYYAGKNKYIAASFPLAGAILVKLFPALFIPLLFRKFGFKKSVISIGITLLIVSLFMLPFIPEKREINESLITYLSTWSFNGSLYKITDYLTGFGSDSRLITYSLFIAGIIIISFRYNNFTKAVFYSWILYIICTPTLYPWYLGWVSAMLPLVFSPALLSLLFFVNFSNVTPLAKTWTEFNYVLFWEYIPFYLLLIYEIIFLKKKDRNCFPITND